MPLYSPVRSGRLPSHLAYSVQRVQDWLHDPPYYAEVRVWQTAVDGTELVSATDGDSFGPSTVVLSAEIAVPPWSLQTAESAQVVDSRIDDLLESFQEWFVNQRRERGQEREAAAAAAGAQDPSEHCWHPMNALGETPKRADCQTGAWQEEISPGTWQPYQPSLHEQDAFRALLREGEVPEDDLPYGGART